MSLDLATVRRIASLARIRLEEPELMKLQGELSGILAWIDQLNEVDVTGIEPLTERVGAPAKMRDDRVEDGGYRDEVLGNAPERLGDYYAVPKVVE